MPNRNYPEFRQSIDTLQVRTQTRGVLPNQYTNLEYDIAAVTFRICNVPIDLASLVDAKVAPAPILPFLAWEYATNLWDDDWSEARKRKIIVNSHFLHSLKGTIAGFREHLAYADAQLVKVVAPPVKAFAGRSYTKAERQAWLAPMPQVRLYQYITEGSAKGKSIPSPRKPKLFCGRTNANKAGWQYRSFLPLTDASNRIGTRGFLYDPLDKSLTPLRTEHVVKSIVTGADVDTYTLHRKGAGGLAVFPGKGRTLGGKRCILGGVQASAGLYTVSIDGTFHYESSALATSTLQPSLTPVTASFQQVNETGTASPASCFPKAAGKRKGTMMALTKRFLPRSTAGLRVYQQMYLFDPTRATALRKARTFLNGQRLGIPAFTAELSIVVINKRPKLAVNRFVRGFLYKTPSKKLDFAIRAVRVSKAARDKILVRTGNYKVPSLSAGFPLDTGYRFGDRILEI